MAERYKNKGRTPAGTRLHTENLRAIADLSNPLRVGIHCKGCRQGIGHFNPKRVFCRECLERLPEEIKRGLGSWDDGVRWEWIGRGIRFLEGDRDGNNSNSKGSEPTEGL